MDRVIEFTPPVPQILFIHASDALESMICMRDLCLHYGTPYIGVATLTRVAKVGLRDLSLPVPPMLFVQAPEGSSFKVSDPKVSCRHVTLPVVPLARSIEI